MSTQPIPRSSQPSSDATPHKETSRTASDTPDGLWQYFHLLCGVVYTLLFSVSGCYVSIQVVNGISPRHALDADAAMLACLVGSVALGLSTASVLSHLPFKSRRDASKANQASSVHDPALVIGCLLSSALAMPVGMAVVPGLATETFGVRVALVRGACGATFVALCVLVKWAGWLDKPERRVIPLQTTVRR